MIDRKNIGQENDLLPKMILIVDDQLALRRSLAEYLRLSGYTVWEAGNGLEAWDVLLSLPREIKLMILDVNMPHMSGLELLRKVHGEGFTMPVILSSGYDQSELPEAMHSYMTAYLKKPYTVTDFLSLVENVLLNH